MPSGFRCSATSFSGLTTGILAKTLHIMVKYKKSNVSAAKCTWGPVLGLDEARKTYGVNLLSYCTPPT